MQNKMGQKGGKVAARERGERDLERQRKPYTSGDEREAALGDV